MRNLPNEDLLLIPRCGPAAAASDFGIDLSLTLENLRLSPDERIKRLDRAREMTNELSEARRSAHRTKERRPLLELVRIE